MFLSPNDAKIIKVASSSLSAKRFLKGEDNTGHTVPVPDGPKDAVSKPAENNSSTHTHASMSRGIQTARRQLYMTFAHFFNGLLSLCWSVLDYQGIYNEIHANVHIPHCISLDF